MNGSKVAKLRLETLSNTLESLKESSVPKLSVIVVSANVDSQHCVNQKVKTAKNVSISTEVHRFEKSMNVSTAKLNEQLIDQESQ